MALRKVGPVGPVNIKTYLAESAVTRGYGVKAGTNESGATAVATAGAQGIGIAAETTASGDALAVIRHGDAFAIAGAAANPGTYAKFNATGQAIAVTRTAGGAEEVIGRFESKPAAAGDECIIFVDPFTLTTPAA